MVLAMSVQAAAVPAKLLNVGFSQSPTRAEIPVLQMLRTTPGGAAMEPILSLEAVRRGASTAINTLHHPADVIRALTNGNVDAAVLSIQDAVAVAAEGRLDLVVLCPIGYSNGLDQLRVPLGWTAATLRSKTVLGEDFSPGHYLVFRFLQKNNLPLRNYLVWRNTPDKTLARTYRSALHASFPSAAAVQGAACETLAQNGGDGALFTSHDIPEEMIDVLVARKDRIAGRENGLAACVAAHFDIQALLADSATQKKTMESMGLACGLANDAALFGKIWKEITPYATPAEAKAVLEGPKFQEALAKAREFYATYGRAGMGAGTITCDSRFIGGTPQPAAGKKGPVQR